MIDYENTVLVKLSAHQIGNKTNGEDVNPSRSEQNLTDDDTKEVLLKYFIKSFTSTELYNFTSTNDDHKLNPLFQFSQNIFESHKAFHVNSVSIAKHLYEVSIHPQIKSGDLFVALFTGIKIDNELQDAIGIFKSESKTDFIKVNPKRSGDFELNCEQGINTEKLDKGCLIYNVDEDLGYRISIIDKSSKSSEAQFWKDLFLKVKPINNNFHATKNFLEITRHYVVDQITEEFELSKPEQKEYLTKSIDYFKNHEEFDKREFEKEVFEDPNVIKSFRKFEGSFREQFDIEMEDNFEIASEAVKKQSRVFKSVLKLDKNFHIYIHGDSKLIEKGVEKDGRKFYKIYYKEDN
jgi:hypothetical protein